MSAALSGGTAGGDGAAVVGGVLADLDAGLGIAGVRLSGGLRLGTVPAVRRVLAKLLVDPGRVAVDLPRS